MISVPSRLDHVPLAHEGVVNELPDISMRSHDDKMISSSADMMM